MNPLHFVLALVVVCIWGFNFVAIRVGLNGIPPLLLVFARFFLTSIPAIFFIKRPNIPFRKVVIYGLVMFALQFSLLFIGIGLGVAPGLASLITQVQIFFSILLGAIFFNETPHRWQFIGCLISFIGLLVVAMHVEGTVSIEGFFCLVGAAFFWSAGNLLSKKMGKVNTLSLVIWSSFIAWPPLLLLSILFEGYDTILLTLSNLSLTAAGATLYITYFSTLLGYGLWSYLIHHMPLATISSFTILIPIVAILSSVIVLNEPLEWWKILAALLVISGLAINLFGKKLTSNLRKLSYTPKNVD